ncbi:expressed unknown protein [Seminavis robusta]|uniref:Uncharacterized protein n=1 Tax=Seminavis robusta TaxID=568900 RepID=A0A9N8ET23_9STRA|nr:expressed unknown protein [Seminavis robusta]|eukprot:Sro1690_g291380.1 n/a (156) ;mRNA; r:16073-16540
MDILVLAVQNSLRKTKKRALGVLEQAMEKAPYRVPFKHVETLVSIMQQDKNCRDAIWAMLQKFRLLPPNLIQFPSDDLLENPLLPMLIAERTTSPVIFMKAMTSRVLQIVQQEGNTFVSQTLAEDSLIGRFVRPHLETIPPRNDSPLSLDHEHGV